MKTHTIPSRSSGRVRKFTREILLASAITMAAIVMLLMSREPTEIAAVPAEKTPVSVHE